MERGASGSLCARNAPSTREQRCWVHKTANVADKLPNTLQLNAKAKLHGVWVAPTRAAAIITFDHFLEDYSAKYSNTTDCLKKDRDELLTFYDLPAEHWNHNLGNFDKATIAIDEALTITKEEAVVTFLQKVRQEFSDQKSFRQ